MTPKEKARELVDKYLNEQSYTEEIYDAKQCALICVDEMLNVCDWKTKPYLIEVKQEILKQ